MSLAIALGTVVDALQSVGVAPAQHELER